MDGKEKEKEEKFPPGLSPPDPAPKPKRRKSKLACLLMLFFGVFTSSYLLLWLLIAFRVEASSTAGAFKWPSPPKLSELSAVLSSLYKKDPAKASEAPEEWV